MSSTRDLGRRQPPRCLTHQNGAGLGDLLQPRGQIGRVADGGVVHAEVVTDPADDHRAAVESHPDGQSGAFRPPEVCLSFEAAPDADGRQAARRAWSS